jgi:hypothetical protein
VEYDEGRIRLNGYQRWYTELETLFVEIGYSAELLQEITDVVMTKSFDTRIKITDVVEF